MHRYIIIIITVIALLIILSYTNQNELCSPDNGIFNVVGVKGEDPEDGHEDNQDHDGSKVKDSPRKAMLKMLNPLKKSSFK